MTEVQAVYEFQQFIGFLLMMLKSDGIPARWENTGGNVFCIVVDVPDGELYFGTQSANWEAGRQDKEGCSVEFTEGVSVVDSGIPTNPDNLWATYKWMKDVYHHICLVGFLNREKELANEKK